MSEHEECTPTEKSWQEKYEDLQMAAQDLLHPFNHAGEFGHHEGFMRWVRSHEGKVEAAVKLRAEIGLMLRSMKDGMLSNIGEQKVKDCNKVALRVYCQIDLFETRNPGVI